MALKYRHTIKEDEPKLDAWVSADLAHKDIFTGSHFILPENAPKGIQCIEVSDDEGPIFCLKFTNALLIEAQFPPKGEIEDIRIAKGLKEAFGFFSGSFKDIGFHAMLFDSVSEKLIKFFEQFGFKRLSDFFKVNL